MVIKSEFTLASGVKKIVGMFIFFQSTKNNCINHLEIKLWFMINLFSDIPYTEKGMSGSRKLCSGKIGKPIYLENLETFNQERVIIIN